MPLSNEILLKPRIRVIAPYPNSPYKIGDLMECSGDAFYLIKFGQCKDFVSAKSLEPFFSHLLKPLVWWEERELADFPEYVETQMHGEAVIVKVIKWLAPEMKGMPPRFEHGSAKGKSPWSPYSIMPSTEENYNAYLAGTYYDWQR